MTGLDSPRVVHQTMQLGKAWPLAVTIPSFAGTLDALVTGQAGNEQSLVIPLVHAADGPIQKVLVTPVGRTLGAGAAFDGNKDDGYFQVSLVRRSAIGGGDVEVLTSTPRIQFPASWSVIETLETTGVLEFGDPLGVRLQFVKNDATKDAAWKAIDDLCVTVMFSSIVEAIVGPYARPNHDAFESGLGG